MLQQNVDLNLPTDVVSLQTGPAAIYTRALVIESSHNPTVSDDIFVIHHL